MTLGMAPSGRETPIPTDTMMGCDIAGIDPHDLATVAMGAASWAAGIPLERNENLATFQECVNRVLGAFGLSFDFEHFDGMG